jgi:hypothetical protein
MKYVLAAIVGLLFASPAYAQAVVGCGAPAIATVDNNNQPKLGAAANCFDKAGAIAANAAKARRDRIVMLRLPVWIPCAAENASCKLPSIGTVRYGANGKYVLKAGITGVNCDNANFGDPIPGVVKTCDYMLAAGAGPPVVAPTPAPNAPPAPVSVPAPTIAPVPVPAPVAPVAVPKTTIGVNVAGSVYYAGERTFANLAFASGGWVDQNNGYTASPAAQLSPAGYPLDHGLAFLNVPNAVWLGTPTLVRCDWQGSGAFRVDGDRIGEVYGDHTFSVTWKGWDKVNRPSMIIYVTGVTPADPPHDLYCTEAGVVKAGALGQFDQRMIDDLKPFAMIRFLDWSAANGNPPSVTWAARTLPGNAAQNGVDNMAIEHMIDLANAAGSDAWFNVPWNADADYVQRMGQLVHDRLATTHKAYFELSNEVWNYQFKQAAQALNEGLAEALSTDKYTNNLYRLAEKSIWMNKILTPIFADNSTRLVRVVASQNANPWLMQQIIAFKDTAQWVDALATAPYFGNGTFDGANATVTDLPALFATIEKDRLVELAQAVQNKATATKYGKRYIAYESGQTVMGPGKQALLEQIERSPLMYDEYVKYIADWKTQIGDELTIYSFGGPISQYGAWGIREHSGQPLSDTPKRRAVLEAIAGLK